MADCVAVGDQASYCGVYVPLSKLQEAGTDVFYETFHINIPYNDILPFQAFTVYPNAIFGKLELYFKFNKDALVYMQVDPIKAVSDEYNAYYSTKYSSTDRAAYDVFRFYLGLNHADYTREYTQINDAANIIEDFELMNQTHGSINVKQITLSAVSMQIVNCSATVIGEKMLPEVLEAEKAKYMSVPSVVPSQTVDYYPYSSGVSSSGVNDSYYLPKNICVHADFVQADDYLDHFVYFANVENIHRKYEQFKPKNKFKVWLTDHEGNAIDASNYSLTLELLLEY